MKIVPIQCPNCGAKLKADDDRKFIFCEYCGTQIFLDDEVLRTEHHEYDEARIEEAKTKRILGEKASELAKDSLSLNRKIIYVVAGIIILLLLIMVVAQFTGHRSLRMDASELLFFIMVLVALFISKRTGKNSK